MIIYHNNILLWNQLNKNNMKRLSLMLLAILGLFLFNGCKDEDPQPNPAESYETIDKLKSLTGISAEEAINKLKNEGYAYLGIENEGEVYKKHIFTANPASTYELIEANGIIYQCEYSEKITRSSALDTYDKFLKETTKYMSGKTYEYEGRTEINYFEFSSFTTHQEFSTYYEANRNTLASSIEIWETTKEKISVQFKDVGIAFRPCISYSNKQYDPNSSSPAEEAYKSVVKLRNLTGISSEEAISRLRNFGNMYLGATDIDNIKVYTFVSKTLDGSYELFGFNNIIFYIYYYEDTDLNIALTKFEKHSIECNNYMVGKTYDYNAQIKDNNSEMFQFTSHTDFLTSFSLNKNDIITCGENWELTNEEVATAYDNYNNNYEPKAYLFYRNKQYTPANFKSKEFMMKRTKQRNWYQIKSFNK